MFLFEPFIRIARSVLDGVLGQITQNINIVEDQVQARLQSYVQEVMGGMWTGRGADAFVEAVSTEAMPKLTDVTGEVGDFGNSIRSALDIMDNAEKMVGGVIDGLVDLFDGI